MGSLVYKGSKNQTMLYDWECSRLQVYYPPLKVLEGLLQRRNCTA